MRKGEDGVVRHASFNRYFLNTEQNMNRNTKMLRRSGSTGNLLLPEAGHLALLTLRLDLLV